MNETPRILGNRYEVGDVLGRGGMAEVHIGRDARLGRTVAIKLLRSDLARDPLFQARFRREAQSAAGLNHPAIVAVYDTGEETLTDITGQVMSLPYIVMEYVQGQTLRQMLGEGQTMDVDLALEVTSGVLSALDYSHRAGIVHRDIKPANVMVTPQGDVKVMDFGIARALSDATGGMTQTQAVIGTAQYLSPEQARGETVDIRSDLYSTGCLLFELLAGRPPFVADSPVAVAYQHVREMPQAPSTFNPGVPEVVDRIVGHALVKDREARYQTAADFRADIEAARAGRRVATPAAAFHAQGPNTGATEYFTGSIPGPPTQGNYYGGPPTGAMTGYETARSSKGRTALFALLGVAAAGALVVTLVLTGAFGSKATPNATDSTTSSVAPTSTAPASFTMPTVTGDDEDSAVSELVTFGFDEDNITTTTDTSDTVAKGDVISQDPSGGSSVTGDKTTTTVKLVISSGTQTVTVPSLANLTLDEAKAALERAHLTAGQNTVRVDEGGVEGTVVGSDPAKGKSLAPGSVVTLNVTTGFWNIPAAAGANPDTFIGDLEDRGFKVTVIQVPVPVTDPNLNTVQGADKGGRTKSDTAVTVWVYVSDTATATPTPTPSIT